MITRNRLLMAGVLMLAGCGLGTSAEPTTPTTSATSQALHCGSEPTLVADGVANSVGCAFEQQWENISHNGTRFSAPASLTAAGQPLPATASAECGDWLLATDSQGVTIFINKVDGEVHSHGSIHPGFATSTLPSTVALPIEH
jgi:hypothetical protein